MLPQSQMCYLHNKRKSEGCASPFLEHFFFVDHLPNKIKNYYKVRKELDQMIFSYMFFL